MQLINWYDLFVTFCYSYISRGGPAFVYNNDINSSGEHLLTRVVLNITNDCMWYIILVQLYYSQNWR
jgi:hypothetical protein